LEVIKLRGIPNITNVASLIGDKSRAIMLDALLNKEKISASQLAKKANITLQTASSHLSKLVDGNLIDVVSNGRSKFYFISRPEVAEALEALSLISKDNIVNSLNEYSEATQHQKARSCYDHLAGSLGVRVTESLIFNNYLMDTAEGKNYELTLEGEIFITNLGINLSELRKLKRHFARKCLDWSEQKHHLAGALGATIQNKFLEEKWITKTTNTRIVLLTDSGVKHLKSLFNVSI